MSPIVASLPRVDNQLGKRHADTDTTCRQKYVGDHQIDADSTYQARAREAVRFLNVATADMLRWRSRGPLRRAHEANSVQDALDILAGK